MAAPARSSRRIPLLSAARRRPVLDLRYAQRGALEGRETFTRASTAWEDDETSFSSNVPRFPSGLGLRIEPARTNSLANPASPATQTISLGTGTFTLFVKGGSCEVAANTATGSGFGTATEGSRVVFTISGAGTVDFTVTGSLDWFNCQAGAFRTTPILAAAAGTTRAADVCSFELSAIGVPASPVGLTWLVKGRTAPGIQASLDQYFGQLDNGTSGTRVGIYRRASDRHIRLVASVGAGEVAHLDLGEVLDDTEFRAWFCIAANNFACALVGGSTATDTNGAMPPGLTTKHVGYYPYIAELRWSGTIARDITYNRRLSNAEAAALAARL
jgi:hypothetical protein